MRCRPQFPTLFLDVFPIDPNADVTLFTVPIETFESRTAFVTEAPDLRVPTRTLFQSR